MSEKIIIELARLADVVLIVFIVLKLVGVITWSWWWVLAPLWVPVAFWLILIFIGLIIASVKALKYGKTKQ